MKKHIVSIALASLLSVWNGEAQAAAEGAIATLVESQSAPVGLQSFKPSQGEAVFIVLHNVASFSAHQPSVLWRGDQLVAEVLQPVVQNHNDTRVGFCVTRIMTQNGDAVSAAHDEGGCLGAIHDHSGQSGLADKSMNMDAKEMSVPVTAVFKPAQDLVRQ